MKKNAGAIPNPLIVYHVGSPKLEGDSFSSKFMGGGEGLAFLGPGTYFINVRNIAERYAKYHKEASIYKCLLDTSKIYDPFAGQPTKHRGSLNSILKENIVGEIPRHSPSTLQYGTAEIGIIHHSLGKQKAIEKFIEKGLSGFCQEIGPNVFEVCVFDYSALKVLEKEQIKFKEEVLPQALSTNYHKGSQVDMSELRPGDIFIKDDEMPFFVFVARVLDANNDSITYVQIANSEGDITNQPNTIKSNHFQLYKGHIYRAIYSHLSANALLHKCDMFLKLALEL
jgi:hypothetical protein